MSEQLAFYAKVANLNAMTPDELISEMYIARHEHPLIDAVLEQFAIDLPWISNPDVQHLTQKEIDEMIEETETELADKHDAECDRLRDRIDDLESVVANLESEIERLESEKP